MAQEISYELIAKYFTGNCSDEEILFVENWRDNNPEHLTEFNQYRSIWENARKPEKVFTPDIENAMDKINHKITVDPVLPEKNKIISLVILSRSIAAAIILGLGIWLTYFIIRNNQEPTMLVAETKSDKSELILSDGTHIWLNTNTKISYPKEFKGIQRKITLEGEAWFDVAKNPKIPFIIETQNSITTVVGTEFNLRARYTEQSTTITVNEGKVSFAAKNKLNIQSVYLVAGDKGILDVNENKIVLEKNTSPNYLSWKTGKLVFDNTPLLNVAKDLSSYYNRTIEISDPAKLNIPFTSVFEKKSLPEVLAIIEISLGLNVDTTGNNVILK
jgi:ferric-dicitrate binding protein FerR (iron transport regulator)